MVTKAYWYKFWRKIRQSGIVHKWRDIDPNIDRLTIRHRLKQTIDRYAVDGMIAINYDQMDCDCSQWFSSVVVPAHAMIVERHVDQTYYHAEGPVRWWLSSPETKVEYSSRDLALEAYEDEHSHVVYW